MMRVDPVEQEMKIKLWLGK